MCNKQHESDFLWAKVNDTICEMTYWGHKKDFAKLFTQSMHSMVTVISMHCQQVIKTKGLDDETIKEISDHFGVITNKVIMEKFVSKKMNYSTSTMIEFAEKIKPKVIRDSLLSVLSIHAQGYNCDDSFKDDGYICDSDSAKDNDSCKDCEIIKKIDNYKDLMDTTGDYSLSYADINRKPNIDMEMNNNNIYKARKQNNNIYKARTKNNNIYTTRKKNKKRARKVKPHSKYVSDSGITTDVSDSEDAFDDNFNFISSPQLKKRKLIASPKRQKYSKNSKNLNSAKKKKKKFKNSKNSNSANKKKKKKKTTEKVGETIVSKSLHFGVAEVGEQDKKGKYLCCLNYNKDGKFITKDGKKKFCNAKSFSWQSRQKHHYCHQVRNEVPSTHISYDVVPNVGCICVAPNCDPKIPYCDNNQWTRHTKNCADCKPGKQERQVFLPKWAREYLENMNKINAIE